MASINKGYYGWVATSTVDLSGGRVLQVTTMKRHGGKLVSTAQAAKDNGAGSISYMMYQDFNVALESSFPKRVTEKVVVEQHNRVMAAISDVVAKAKEFYGVVEA